MSSERGDRPAAPGAGPTPAWNPWAPRPGADPRAGARPAPSPPGSPASAGPIVPPGAAPGPGALGSGLPTAPPWSGRTVAAPTAAGPTPPRAPVADQLRTPGAGAHPPGSWPTPKLDGPMPGPRPPKARRSPALTAFVAFLAGAAVVGAAFGAYALGDRRDRVDATASKDDPDRPSDTVDALDIRRILDKAQPSVVSITTGSANSIFGGAGSGVVISDDGLIVTNAHVVATSGGKISVRFNDGTEVPATLVGGFTDKDIALLQVDRTGLVPATLGSSADLRVGDDVVAIGNALALQGDPSVTRGIVSAKDRSIDDGTISLDHLIQTDAAINPGNSGGPLVDAAGEVVGINTAIIQGAQNVGFSLAIDQVRSLFDDIQAGKGDLKADGAVLGVATLTIDASLSDATRQQYGVTATSGALVTTVDPDSAAADAGIVVGDAIVELDGSPITSNEALSAAMRTRSKGDRVTVTVERDGRRRSFDVTLGPR